MSATINAVPPISDLNTLTSGPLQGSGGSGEFRRLFEGTIQQLQSVQDSADSAVGKFLTGENEELHTTVLAVQRAELAFDLGLQVRNKVVSAYQEIMRMQM